MRSKTKNLAWVLAALMATTAIAPSAVAAQSFRESADYRRGVQRTQGAVFLFLLHPLALGLGSVGFALADRSGETGDYLIASGLSALGIGALIGAIVELVGGIRMKSHARREATTLTLPLAFSQHVSQSFGWDSCEPTCLRTALRTPVLQLALRHPISSETRSLGRTVD